mmetsp:Transcript_27580/g.50917  ORF Transcript_27580/g.50917 Transcript_27580/m.50917 type:complete len:216 (+) Transcript_27580:722-1369(+)
MLVATDIQVQRHHDDGDEHLVHDAGQEEREVRVVLFRTVLDVRADAPPPWRHRGTRDGELLLQLRIHNRGFAVCDVGVQVEEVLGAEGGVLVPFHDFIALASAVRFGDDVHQQLGQVVGVLLVLLHFQAARWLEEAEKVFAGHLALQTEIDDAPGDEHEDPVKQRKAEGSRGMNRRTDRHPSTTKALDHRHDLVGGVGVEAGGGLVQEEDLGSGD